MTQFCVYTRDPEFPKVLDWIRDNNISHEIHLNRTRFLVPQGAIMTHFLLRFSHCCPVVDPDADPLLNTSCT